MREHTVPGRVPLQWQVAWTLVHCTVGRTIALESAHTYTQHSTGDTSSPRGIKQVLWGGVHCMHVPTLQHTFTLDTNTAGQRRAKAPMVPYDASCSSATSRSVEPAPPVAVPRAPVPTRAKALPGAAAEDAAGGAVVGAGGALMGRFNKRSKPCSSTGAILSNCSYTPPQSGHRTQSSC